MFIFCGVKDVWAFGLMFSAFHPFLDWALLGQKALIFLLSPCFPFLCSWAFWLLNLPYHFIMSAIALPLLSFLVIPWAYRPVLLLCQPTSSSIFCSGVLSPLFISLPLLGFIGEHSCCGPLPMYWLGTSMWCPGPLHAPLCLNLFLSGLYTISTASMFV